MKTMRREYRKSDIVKEKREFDLGIGILTQEDFQNKLEFCGTRIGER